MPSPLTEAPQPGLADSAAELDPAILATIERELKTSVSDVPPALVAHAVAVSKKCGNEAFCAKRFTDACKFYTQAIAGAPGDKNLRSNRSAAYLALGDYEAALSDAIRCVALDQNWPKAHYRLGKALAAMGEWHAAAATLERCARLITGVGLVPASKDTNTVSTAGTTDTTGSTAGSSTDEPTGSTFNEPSTQTDSTIDTKTLEGVLELLAIAKCESEDARSRMGAHETGLRKDLASRLREARRADDREATLARYVQGLSRIPTPTVYCHVWSAVTQVLPPQWSRVMECGYAREYHYNTCGSHYNKCT
jgi:tetratricopeptide (TPR) repeat protein